MNIGATIDLFRHMLYLVLSGVAIIVVPGLIIGLIVAVFQAATQINEMTLSFLPKLVIMLLVITTFSPWLIQTLIDYTQQLILDIPYYIS